MFANFRYNEEMTREWCTTDLTPDIQSTKYYECIWESTPTDDWVVYECLIEQMLQTVWDTLWERERERERESSLFSYIARAHESRNSWSTVHFQRHRSEGLWLTTTAFKFGFTIDLHMNCVIERGKGFCAYISAQNISFCYQLMFVYNTVLNGNVPHIQVLSYSHYCTDCLQLKGHPFSG